MQRSEKQKRRCLSKTGEVLDSDHRAEAFAQLFLWLRTLYNACMKGLGFVRTTPVLSCAAFAVLAAPGVPACCRHPRPDTRARAGSCSVVLSSGAPAAAAAPQLQIPLASHHFPVIVAWQIQMGHAVRRDFSKNLDSTALGTVEVANKFAVLLDEHVQHQLGSAADDTIIADDLCNCMTAVFHDVARTCLLACLLAEFAV